MPDKQFWIPVEWRGLDDEGCVVPRSLKMRARVIGDHVMKSLGVEDGAICRAVCSDWKGASGFQTSLPDYSEEALEVLLRQEPRFLEAFDQSYSLHRDYKLGRRRPPRLRSLLQRLIIRGLRTT